LAALHCFTKQSLNIVILEVGLGGRLDATNIIDSDVAVITTIGLDHQDWLGYSLDAIGREKAGIMRPQRPVVYGAIDMPSSIQKHATELNAPLYRRGLAFDGGENKDNWFWSGLSTVGNSVKEQDLPIPKLELDNAITALQVLQFLPQPVSHQQIILGLEKAALPGRAQTIQWRNKKGYLIDVVLDVAHNPQAAERLAAFLHKTKKTGKTTAVFAIASDKDRISVLDLLKPHINHWFITAFDSPRALSLAVLTKTLEQIDAEFTPSKNVIEGFTQAVNQSAQEDRVLVTGSFMTVAKVLALVRELPK
ncbi:MAG: Mur ligase family protein, partial [Endozoicomonas sp. (ex Botrylloides leachii)]|nr:Mur ligase family protein [Endozoicomonas sp. (ex Botrylloides leachii)]